MEEIIELNFFGYYITKQLPLKKYNFSGIYTVYAGKITAPDKCSLIELLYIGESKNVGTRPGEGHELYGKWCSYLDRENKEILFYAFTKVSATDRARVEAALIYERQPPCNTENKESFDYDETTIITSGKNARLKELFTVYKTIKKSK